MSAADNFARIIMKVEYIKTGIKGTVNVSKIVTVHYYEFDKSFVFEGESHDFWEMVYVDKGSVLVKCDDEEITLPQGGIVFHRPNEFHAIRALDSSPNFFVISFVSDSSSMKYFEKYRTLLDKNLKPFISSIIRESEQAYIIPKNDTSYKKLTKKKDAAIGAEQLIKTYLEQLLIFLIRAMTTESSPTVFPSKESMEGHIVTEIKRIVEENVCEKLRLTDICNSLGYSKSYVSRLFRQQTGGSIAAFAIEKKIVRAKELIREDSLNFAQISDRLSFDNPQYFARVFKRITGMTPTEFKRSLNV